MCSLHLTHPSVHTWSSGQPTVQRPGSSRGLPVGAGIRTHNFGLHQVSSPTLYPLGHNCPNYYYLLNLLITHTHTHTHIAESLSADLIPCSHTRFSSHFFSKHSSCSSLGSCVCVCVCERESECVY